MQFALMIFAAAIANAVSQTALRIGARQIDAKTYASFMKTTAANKFIVIGVLLFSTSIFLYAFVLIHVDISVAFPAMGLTHIFVSALSYFILRESIDSWKIAGNGMIILGMAMLSISSE